MSSNLFGGNEKKEEFASKVDTHSKTLVTVIQRQKDIESQLESLHEKIEMIDHNAVLDFKKVFSKQKNIKDEITDIKSDIQKILDFQEKITKQLKLFSTVDEVKKLEKYIDLWEPLQFVSKEELEKAQKKSEKQIIDKLTKVLEKVLKE